MCFIYIPEFKKVVVAKVLTAQVVRTQAYKFDAAVRFANARLSDLRTEERRKVTIYSFHVPLNMYNANVKQCLGIEPYRSSPNNRACINHHSKHQW